MGSILSWIIDIGNFASSIVIMVGIYRRFVLWLKFPAMYFIISDVISIIVIILYRVSYPEYINIPKISSLFIITPLIIILFHLSKMMRSKGVMSASLLVNKAAKQ